MSASRPVNPIIANIAPPQALSTSDMRWLSELCFKQIRLGDEKYPINSYWIINPLADQQDIPQLKLAAAANINTAPNKVLFCNVPHNVYQECLSAVVPLLKIKVLGLQHITSATMSDLLEKLDFNCIKKIGIHALSENALWLLFNKLLALEIAGVKHITVLCSPHISPEWQQTFADIKGGSYHAELIKDNYILTVNKMLGVINSRAKIQALLDQEKTTAAESKASLDVQIKQLRSQIETNLREIAAKQKVEDKQKEFEAKQREIEQLKVFAKKQKEVIDISVAEIKLLMKERDLALAELKELHAHEADNFLVSHEAELVLQIAELEKKLATQITQQNKIEAENAELKARIQALNAATIDLSKANAELCAAKAELLEEQSSLNQKLADLKIRLDGLQEKFDDVETNSHGLAVQVFIEKQKAVDLEEKSKELITKNADQVVQLQHLKHKLEESPEHHRSSSSHHKHSKRRKTETKPTPEEKQLAESTMQIDLLRTQNASLQTMLVAKEKELGAILRSKDSSVLKERLATSDAERLRKMLQNEKMKSAATASTFETDNLALQTKIKNLEDKLHASEQRCHALEKADISRRDSLMVLGIPSPQSSPFMQSRSSAFTPVRSPLINCSLFPSSLSGLSQAHTSDHHQIPSLNI